MALESEDTDDMLIFGYACKLFRDDECALMIDQGDHLIPWMNDSSLMIGRYDARGALTDLCQYQSPEIEVPKEAYMTPEDILVEEMCDDERYRSADTEENSTTTSTSEQQSGSAIAFNYDETKNGGSVGPNSNGNAAPAAPEISLHQLATVIEKTSEFIATQGAQMEILMRAKEAANPKFQFLNPDNPYHPIYKQVLEKKRARLASGRAHGAAPAPGPTLEEVEASLWNLTRNLPSAAPAVPTCSRPAGSTEAPVSSYSQLVERLRVKRASPEPSPPPPPPPPPEKVTLPTPRPAKSSSNNEAVMVQVPPLEEQAWIDRTASYVCRVGCDKLGLLRNRMPEKFAFLRSDNRYNAYYQYKVALYHEMVAERHREQKARAVASANAATAALSQDQKSDSFPKLKGFFR